MFSRALLCALLVLGSSPASAHSPPIPRWLSLTHVDSSREQVGELLRSLLRDEVARRHERYFGSIDAAWSRERFYDLREPAGLSITGDESTRWYFERPLNQIDPPPTAIKFEISTRSPYKVAAVAYCNRATCAALMHRLAHMPPPAPGRRLDASLRTEWVQLIQSEPCKTGVMNTDPGGYPKEEWRREIGGRVELRLVANSCGEVRGAVSVKSSGNRNLDRAARRQALGWRLPPPSAPSGSHYWATWLEFGSTSGNSGRNESVATGEFTAVPALDP